MTATNVLSESSLAFLQTESSTRRSRPEPEMIPAATAGLPASLATALAGLLLQGAGAGAALVASYTCSLQVALATDGFGRRRAPWPSCPGSGPPHLHSVTIEPFHTATTDTCFT